MALLVTITYNFRAGPSKGQHKIGGLERCSLSCKKTCSQSSVHWKFFPFWRHSKYRCPFGDTQRCSL